MHRSIFQAKVDASNVSKSTPREYSRTERFLEQATKSVAALRVGKQNEKSAKALSQIVSVVELIETLFLAK